MDDYEKLLMEWYMKGFNDELWGKTTVDPEDKLLMKVYSIGATDSIIGDDISGHDEKPPHFSSVWALATEMHTNKEISEMQVRKIFRILSHLRNDGKITL